MREMSASRSTARYVSDDALYQDVFTYDALGLHRSASAADEATSDWLINRLGSVGFTVERQYFPCPTVDLIEHRIECGDQVFEALPAWPPIFTPAEGLGGALAEAGADDLNGCIALLVLPYGGASWAAGGKREAVLEVIRRGALGVIVINEGPSSDIIALNADPCAPPWPVPVLIAAARDRAALEAAASEGARMRLVCVGRNEPDARASNVVARRRSGGRRLVVSTPKSGWFRCAAERGSGVAIFLALAKTLAQEGEADLTFIATSGHELAYAGARAFLHEQAPPLDVDLWLHLGANVAAQQVCVAAGAVLPSGGAAMPRFATVSPELMTPVRQAFSALQGYSEPRLLAESTTAGEVQLFYAAGYKPQIGLVGMSQLFHTPSDRASVATRPNLLGEVSKALLSLFGATGFLNNVAC